MLKQNGKGALVSDDIGAKGMLVWIMELTCVVTDVLELFLYDLPSCLFMHCLLIGR